MPELDPVCLSSQGRNLVAFSGGPDSLCLLHLIAHSRWRASVTAVHIDHGLDPGSADRARRAVELATELGVACRVERVAVDPAHRHGREAAAREARYACLEAMLEPGDHVLTAHHADDQVETLLLRLMRGSGPHGLSGMPRLRPLGAGHLGRPLLAWSRAQILDYLETHALRATEDPTNRELDADRNYLRLEILPAMDRRWPGARRALLRAIALQRDARSALEERARRDLEALLLTDAPGGCLDRARWAKLAPERALALLRHWCRWAGLNAPRHEMLEEFRRQCLEAHPDAVPELVIGEAHLRAWGKGLWLDRTPQPTGRWQVDWPAACDQVTLPDRSRLQLLGPRPPHLADEWVVTGMRPGDRLKTHPARPHHRLTELYRLSGVPPWRRPWIPCLRIGERLVAAGDRLLDHEFARALAQSDARLRWSTPPDPGLDMIAARNRLPSRDN
ncbi:MAG: tRNA lysidine(34) synthetase TilS [Wenzhouxiangellaceae bacterium]